MRSNSLELSGAIMAVAYQTQKVNQQPAGLELFDLSVPEEPRSISFLDCSGANSRGVHQLWFCDGEYVHMASGAPDFEPSHPLDDQFYRCIDVRNPSKPIEVGRWWMPGTKKGETPLPRHKLDKGYRAHNTNVYKQRKDRLYLCYIDGGMFVMDIANKSKPKPISHWTNSPPYTGFMHTAVPLFDRNLLIVTDESTENNAEDWPKLAWVVDARDEKNSSYCHLSAAAGRCLCQPRRPFRRTQHSRKSAGTDRLAVDQIVIGTFFNGGLRAYDISDPYQPKEVGTLPPPPRARRRAPCSSMTSSSTNGASSTRSTATPAAFTRWRWISERVLPLTRCRPVRPQAQARAWSAVAGHRDHRLSRRRKDHVAQALSGNGGRARHCGRRQ
jgi:hypothetical protein